MKIGIAKQPFCCQSLGQKLGITIKRMRGIPPGEDPLYSDGGIEVEVEGVIDAAKKTELVNELKSYLKVGSGDVIVDGKKEK